MESKTIMFDASRSQPKTTKEILAEVFEALEDRGYNGIDQMVGYILSGDPSYITSHNNARNMISRIDRDELVEEILRDYLGK
ncbi:MAG: IreB family regulatory phosphoprotein [Clostridia bacterium]|nr:IreB family regulatory phosphoprotein [Clostridia bacterium]MDO5302618.1 IreB family regulatory phosphoprotein [Clostridia bacterium]